MFQQDVSNFINYLKSAHTSQKFLQQCYQQNQISEPDKKSYQNSYRFLYYLEHGFSFYETGNKADLVSKPILYFYGMVHLLKACLLTKRPDYPENTAMLAHGVSTRKRKKQDYSFLEDEVKIQHKGLFPYVSEHLFHLDENPDQKYDMRQLLATIPEMNSLFLHQSGKEKLIKIGHLNSMELTFPIHLLDSYHLTENKLVDKIMSYIDGHQVEITKNHIAITLERPLSPISKGPFYYHDQEKTFYFPNSRAYFSESHEIVNHYLVLYNLSMICRYETEWWGDLLHTMATEDYPFIQSFLSITSKKVPNLLGYYLLMQKKD